MKRTDSVARICNYPARPQIDLAMATGLSRRAVAARFAVSRDGRWARRAPPSSPMSVVSRMKAAAEQRVREKRCEPSPYLFPARDGNRRVGGKKSWAAVCRAAGKENARLHDLRHTAASVLVSPGVSLPLVGAILGHSNPTTTARHSHLYTDPMREAIDRLGAIVTGGEEPRMVSLRQKRGIG